MADIARMLKKADSPVCSDLPQEKVNDDCARDCRGPGRASFESKIAFARELVAPAHRCRTRSIADAARPESFHEDIFVEQLRRTMWMWMTRDGQHPMRLNFEIPCVAGALYR